MRTSLTGVVARCVRLAVHEASVEELAVVHHRSLLSDVEAASRAGGGESVGEWCHTRCGSSICFPCAERSSSIESVGDGVA